VGKYSPTLREQQAWINEVFGGKIKMRKKTKRVVPEVVRETAANVAELIWLEEPKEPGLHVMKTLRGANEDYTVITAVLRDDGTDRCYLIYWASGGSGQVNMDDFTSPLFQKIKA